MALANLLFINPWIAPEAICKGFCLHAQPVTVEQQIGMMPIDLRATEDISAEDQRWLW